MKDNKIYFLAMSLIMELREQGHNIDPSTSSDYFKSWITLSERRADGAVIIFGNSMKDLTIGFPSFQQNIEKFGDEVADS